MELRGCDRAQALRLSRGGRPIHSPDPACASIPVGVKGIILAGGSGSRLLPATQVTNKHLLPVYDKPMIFYAVEQLVGSGIDRIMIVTGGNHAGEFLRLLGNGST